MDEVISLMQSSKITDPTLLPVYILKDLDFICDCYIHGITEMNFGNICEDMFYQDGFISISYDMYQLILKTIELKLIQKNVTIIDEVLLFTYVDYYVNQLEYCKLSQKGSSAMTN